MYVMFSAPMVVFEIAGAKQWNMADEKLLGSWTGLKSFQGRFGAFFHRFSFRFHPQF